MKVNIAHIRILDSFGEYDKDFFRDIFIIAENEEELNKKIEEAKIEYLEGTTDSKDFMETFENAFVIEEQNVVDLPYKFESEIFTTTD